MTHLPSEELWWMWKVEEMRHRHRLNPMRSMHHATSNALILLVVCFLLRCSCRLSHLLKVVEHLISEGMCLSLHHGHLFFVHGTLTMNWTGSHEHLVFVLVHALLKVEVATSHITRLAIRMRVVMVWVLLGGLVRGVLAPGGI